MFLLFCGVLLWSIAALAFAAIREDPGATEGGRNALGEARAGLALIAEKPWYRRYLAARTALLSIEIAAPFYILYVREMLSLNPGALGLIVISTGVAAALSSPIWGRFADLSSRKVLLIGGIMGAITGIAAIVIGILAQVYGIRTLIVLLIVLGIGGAVISFGLPEASSEQKT